MKALDDAKLQLGDIVLTTRHHYVSKAIRTATKCDISHAMIYIARGSAIDSTGEGVQETLDVCSSMMIARFTSGAWPPDSQANSAN